MLRTILAVLAAFVLPLTATPAAAQRALEIDAGGYRHPHSGFGMPGTLMGMPMVRLSDLDGGQLDVAAMYDDAARGEVISVYIYRLVSGALPVWFDRAVWAIENRTEMYGNPKRVPGAAVFVPPGQVNASGLAATWSVAKGSIRSTGLALVQMDGWLIKIRYTSDRLSAPDMAVKVRDVLNALTWPKEIGEAPAAYEIAPCTTRLKLSGTAKTLPLDAKDYASAAMAGTIGEQAPMLGRPAANLWCRDSTALPTGGVYRGDEEHDGFLIALSDAGRGVRVQPDESLGRMGKGPAWSVQIIDMARTVILPSQDRLPSPERAIEMLRTSSPVAAFGTFGKDRQVQLTVGPVR